MEFFRPNRDLSSLLVVLNNRAQSLTGSKEQEFCSLIEALSIKNTDSMSINLREIHPRYLVGKGQLALIQDKLIKNGNNQVIFNLDISARHRKILEEELKVPIFDRTAIILDIFSRRAKTYEGKLQVELAQIEYSSTHLIRGWTHLERQRSALGQRGGPGEKQLEIDRRILRTKKRQIERRINKIKKQRNLSRNARQKAGLQTVSLVGYTNAGKSTLFNALTNSNAYASSKPFATLDPTIRKVCSESSEFLLADTVGFIESLSRGLINSFAATLGEIKESSLILHLVDISDDKLINKIDEVNSIIKILEAEDTPTLMVYNKCDIMTAPNYGIVYNKEKLPKSVCISARTKYALDSLLLSISMLLKPQISLAV